MNDTDQPTDGPSPQPDSGEADPAAPSEQSLPLEHAGEGITAEDPVEDASADSFPASDPPSFTGGSSSR